MGPSFLVKTSSPPEQCQLRTWFHAKHWKPHPTFDVLFFPPVPLRNVDGHRVGRGRMIRTASCRAGQVWRPTAKDRHASSILSSRYFLPWDSGNSQNVEIGVFGCLLLKLVSLLICGKVEVSSLLSDLM